MDAVSSFNMQYKFLLHEAVTSADLPPELVAKFEFESCIRRDKSGKKEVYLVARKSDRANAILKVTTNYPQEDAIEEARMLCYLNHEAIPKL